MSQSEIERKIRQLRELEALIDEARQEADGIRDELKVYMGVSEELRAGEYKISWKVVTSARFDASAFKATHGELYSQYMRQSSTRRFCVA